MKPFITGERQREGGEGTGGDGRGGEGRGGEGKEVQREERQLLSVILGYPVAGF